MATVHFGRLQGAAGFARSVAIKRLHPQYAKDPDFVAMFLDEARLAARISHPNVVPTLDVVSQADELFLVMEYVRGAPLSRLIRALKQRGDRIPPRITAAILSGVLHGLHAAHDAKSETGERLDIVHRDVSPQNILVGTDGIARVLDFGVAKAAGRMQSTREGQLKGKIAYMAPEQITTGIVSRKTDIYAASVVLWEVLTGRRLFSAENEAKVMAVVLDGDVDPPSKLQPTLPDGFDRVVLRGLDKDPAKRFATAREMAAEVESVVGVAPPTEIGEWVEGVAAEELRERARRIEEIERSVVADGSWPSGVSFQSPQPLDAPTPVGRRVDEPQTVQLGPRAVAVPPLEVPSLVSNLAMVHTDRPPYRSRTRSAGILAAVFILGILTAFLFVAYPAARGAHQGPGIASPMAPAGSIVAAPTVALGTESTDGGAPANTEVPSADSPDPSASPPPANSGTAAETAMASGAAPTPAELGPKHQPRTAPAPAVDCTLPYTTDERGHVHFKPDCL
jgi:serine/threonine-protein kinase